MTDNTPPTASTPPATTSLDPREIYLAYTSLAIIVAAFVAVVFVPDSQSGPAAANLSASHAKS